VHLLRTSWACFFDQNGLHSSPLLPSVWTASNSRIERCMNWAESGQIPTSSGWSRAEAFEQRWTRRCSKPFPSDFSCPSAARCIYESDVVLFPDPFSDPGYENKSDAVLQRSVHADSESYFSVLRAECITKLLHNLCILRYYSFSSCNGSKEEKKLLLHGCTCILHKL